MAESGFLAPGCAPPVLDLDDGDLQEQVELGMVGLDRKYGRWLLTQCCCHEAAPQ